MIETPSHSMALFSSPRPKAGRCFPYECESKSGSGLDVRYEYNAGCRLGVCVCSRARSMFKNISTVTTGGLADGDFNKSHNMICFRFFSKRSKDADYVLSEKPADSGWCVLSRQSASRPTHLQWRGVDGVPGVEVQNRE